jgi:hypothetical protein
MILRQYYNPVNGNQRETVANCIRSEEIGLSRILTGNRSYNSGFWRNSASRVCNVIPRAWAALTANEGGGPPRPLDPACSRGDHSPPPGRRRAAQPRGNRIHGPHQSAGVETTGPGSAEPQLRHNRLMPCFPANAPASDDARARMAHGGLRRTQNGVGAGPPAMCEARHPGSRAWLR